MIKEYLKKLGIEKVQTFDNGKKGIAGFKKEIKSGNNPIIFLDYNLPDMTGFSVMTQIIKLQPDVKVIIETALGKEETEIRDVIAQGAWQYLSKPIRFENVKQIIHDLDVEESTFSDNDDNLVDEVAHMINRNTQISFAKISEFFPFSTGSICSA